MSDFHYDESGDVGCLTFIGIIALLFFVLLVIDGVTMELIYHCTDQGMLPDIFGCSTRSVR